MSSKLDFIGRNIRYLRRQRGWSIAKLAAKIGIKEAPLGRIERGENAPSARVILCLSKSLNIPTDALFSEKDQDLDNIQLASSGDPFLVVLDQKQPPLPPKTKAQARQIVMAFHALEDICRVPKSAKIPLFIPFEADKEGMEKLAETVRHFMKIESGVVFDYFELFENLGFRVLILPLPGTINSFTYYDRINQNAFFFVNSRNNPERQLFCLGYELGRVLIFTQSVQQGRNLFDDEEDRDINEQVPFTSHRAARRFAATFLMPASAIRETVAQLGIKQKKWSYELLLRIKHRFGISTETFLYRLDELSLIDPSLVQFFSNRIDEHYQKTNYSEPGSTRRILTPNGRLWDLILTGKEYKKDRKEVLEIEKKLNQWKLEKK